MGPATATGIVVNNGGALAFITLASKMIKNHVPAAYWTQGCRK
jgi:hypothetical protein